MVKVYSVLLLVGFVGLLIVVMGGTLADNLDRPERDPNRLIGRGGRLAMGAVLGFSMGGMAAEFSPLDLSWPVAFLIAVGAGGLGLLWVRYAEQLGSDG